MLHKKVGCITFPRPKTLPRVFLTGIDRPSPEPSSTDIKYLQEWKKPWHEVDFDSVIEEWTK